MSHSNSVAQQSWKIIESTTFRVEEEVVRQEEKERQVTSPTRVVQKQQIAKDVLLPAALAGECATSLKGKASETAESARLPSPDFSGGDASFGEDQGLISIIGTVLALQAKSNSNFWSNLWEQTSESMLQQVKFAPLIAEATENAAKNQADGTRQQAAEELINGPTNLVMFVGSVGMAAFQEVKNPEYESTTSNAKFREEDNPANKPQATDKNSTASQAQQQNKTESQQIQKQISEADANPKNKIQRGVKNAVNKSNLKPGFAGFLEKLYRTSSSMSALSQGSSALVSQRYQSNKANYEQAQGVQEAFSKEAEQYAQFYGQDFSQGTNLAQGSAQNIDYAMNILKSASDTITQSVNSMFRG